MRGGRGNIEEGEGRERHHRGTIEGREKEEGNQRCLVLFLQTVNSNLKRSEHELSELNTTIADINLEARTIAPYLRMVVSQGPKKSPSPMRQKLFKGVPKVFLGGASKPAAVPSLPKEQEEGQGLPPKIPEAQVQSPGQSSRAGQSSSEVEVPKIPEAEPSQSSGPKIPEALSGQGPGPKIPEAHPGGVASSEA